MRQLHPNIYAPQVSSLIELLLPPNAATAGSSSSSVVIISCILEALSRFQKLSDGVTNEQRGRERQRERRTVQAGKCKAANVDTELGKGAFRVGRRLKLEGIL